MAQDLLTVKEDFTALIGRVQPWVLSHFIMWLDLKIAEYKVYGYMVMDHSSQHLNVPRVDVDDGNSIPVIPTPPTKKKIQSQFSQNNDGATVKHRASIGNMFLQRYSSPNSNYVGMSVTNNSISPGKSPFRVSSPVGARLPVTVLDHSTTNTTPVSQPVLTGERNRISSKRSDDGSLTSNLSMESESRTPPKYSNDGSQHASRSPSTSRSPHCPDNRSLLERSDSVIAVKRGPNDLDGVTVVSLSFGNTDEPKGENSKIVKENSDFSTKESITFSSTIPFTKDSDSHEEAQMEDLPALYKNQQFSKLISSQSRMKSQQSRNASSSDDVDLASGQENLALETEYLESQNNTSNNITIEAITQRESNSENQTADIEEGQEYLYDIPSEMQHKSQPNPNESQGHLSDDQSQNNTFQDETFLESSNQSQKKLQFRREKSQNAGSDPKESVFVKFEQEEDDCIIMGGDEDERMPSSSSSTNQSFIEDNSGEFSLGGSAPSGIPTVVPVDLVSHNSFVERYRNKFSSTHLGFPRRYNYKSPYYTNTMGSKNACNIPRDPSTGKFKCIVCAGLFQNRSSYFRHKSLHGEKKFCCLVCLKKFHRKEHIQMHLNRHGKTGTLLCPVCQMSAGDAHTLENHMCLVHSVVNMYTYGMKNADAPNDAQWRNVELELNTDTLLSGEAGQMDTTEDQDMN